MTAFLFSGLWINQSFFFFSKWKKNLQTFYFYFVFQCYNARIAFCILTVNDEHNKTNLGLKQSVQVKFKDGICAKLYLKLSFFLFFFFSSSDMRNLEWRNCWNRFLITNQQPYFFSGRVGPFLIQKFDNSMLD